MSLNGRGSILGRDKNFLEGLSSPPSLLATVFFPRSVKRPECETYYSSPSNADVKDSAAIPPLHHTSS
jgi:hypothetical protein